MCQPAPKPHKDVLYLCMDFTHELLNMYWQNILNNGWKGVKKISSVVRSKECLDLCQTVTGIRKLNLHSVFKGIQCIVWNDI